LADRALIEILIEGLDHVPPLYPASFEATDTTSSTVYSRRVITVPVGAANAPLGYVEFSAGPSFAAESLATTRQALILAALGATALAILVGLFVSRSLTAPLRNLTAATDAMSAGNLTIRASVQSQDEIGRLAGQFNHMASRLEASFAELAAERDALRRFIADASHEFRTPITALKNFNELLQGAAAADPAAREEFLLESEQQLQRLDWITQNLLNLSRFDAGLIKLNLTPCDVGTLLTAVESAFKAAAEKKEVALTLNPPHPPLTLSGDQPHLESALCNLLDNAIRFTPVGGRIELGATLIIEQTKSNLIRLWVKDTGPGIHSDDLPHLFKRFYRGRFSNQTSSQLKGSGLGLAIVQSIVQLHQGQVHASNNDAGGSCFAIDLPLELNHK
jgi:signal transduction histidine kinase